MDFATTLAAVRSLSPEERIRLVQVVCDDLAADQACPDLTEAQQRELDRRLADDDANPDDVIPWETIRAEARARSRR
jgi:putative addiction module component (TIGR02574 family)